MSFILYTRSAEQQRRNERLGPAHIARPLRHIRAHRAAMIHAEQRCGRDAAFEKVAQDTDYLFFKKAAALGMGHVVTAGARAIL